MSTFEPPRSDVRPEPIVTEDGPAFRTTYDRSSDVALSVVVVDAVKAVLDESPATVGTLYDVIDPDALDSLFEPKADGTPRAGGTVEFTLADCEVTVRGDGDVIVAPPRES
jgi:hypothetical protein